MRHPRARDPPPWSSALPLACVTAVAVLSQIDLESVVVSEDVLDKLLESHISVYGNDHHFFFVWASPWNTWRPVHDLFLQSLFAHNPDALAVCVMSYLGGHNEPHPLSAYQKLGYKIVGVHSPFGAGSAALPAWWTSDSTKNWLTELDPASNPLAYTHSSDYFRFYLLYRYGGCYTDVDAIFLRTLPSGGFVGADWSKNTISWFFDTERHVYLAPGVIRASRRGLEVLRTLLEKTFTLLDYDATCFNCVGPKALNLALKRELGGTSSAFGVIYNALALYPTSFLTVNSLFNGSTAAVPMLVESLRRRSLSTHLFGHTSQNFVIHPGSALAYIGESFALSRILRQMPMPEEAAVPIIAEFSKRTSACSLGGQSREAAPGIVVIGNSAVLRDANLIFVRNCASLELLWKKGALVQLQLDVEAGELRSTSRANIKCLPQSRSFGTCLFFSDLSTLADINRALGSVVYVINAATTRRDKLTIRLTSGHVERLLQESISILIFSRLVTVITHTHGRLGPVQRMYDSIQTWYPGTRLLVSDDGGNNDVKSGFEAPFASVIQLPFDAGLSAGRNTLVATATTPYVFLLDDDFTVSDATHLDYLLRVLEADAPGGRYHFASTVIPADVESFAFHFRGLMETHYGDLVLSPGSYGTAFGCTHVDFVPNVFMARRSTLKHVRWDPDLKLGEHEEFFLRAKKSGVRILSCDHAEVEHHQLTWWTGTPPLRDAAYVEKRKRVYEFFKLALRKAGLKRLVSFGSVMASI